jgi:hypothetical protein
VALAVWAGFGTENHGRDARVTAGETPGHTRTAEPIAPAHFFVQIFLLGVGCVAVGWAITLGSRGER